MKVTPDRAFNFVRTGARLIYVWPPPPDARSYQLIVYEFTWWLSVLLALSIIIPLAMAIYEFIDDPPLMMRALTELLSIVEIPINMILFKIQRPRLQILISEMTNFFKVATLHEKMVLQKYIDRSMPLHLLFMASDTLIVIAFCCGPLVTSKSFPVEAWYPFSMEPLPTKCLVYFMQVLAITQTAACFFGDIVIASLLWYAVARFQILAMEFENVTDEHQLCCCIRKHQALILFAQQVNSAFRLVILKTSMVMTLGIMCTSYQLTHYKSLSMLSQFFLLLMANTVELYINAWPADELMDASMSIARSVYNSQWIGKSSKLLRSMAIVTIRSQRAVVISISGILPSLSLQFYASFLTTALSYLMTLRAVIGE